MSKYLVLGGCGFVGRNIVHHLVQQMECEKVVVCDKCRPELSWLTKEQLASFKSDKVIFKQINLSVEANVIKFLADHPCDYVINAAAETRLKLDATIYRDYVYKLGMLCANQAVAMGAKKFIQITSARVKTFDGAQSNSSSSRQILKYQKELEEGLKTVGGLKYAIIRPALIYGIGDTRGLMPFIIMVAIFKLIREELTMLWTPEIGINTVHVEDVVRACVHLLHEEESGVCYELVDKMNTTQGVIVDMVCKMFKVKYRFLAKLENMMAKCFFGDVVDEINSKTLSPWSKACEAEGIMNTPLTSFVNEEQLQIDNFTVDGADIEKTGFTYQHPKLLASELDHIINTYIKQGIFPAKCKP